MKPIINDKHDRYDSLRQWVLSRPLGAEIVWSAWNFEDAPITPYGVTVQFEGYSDFDEEGHSVGALIIDDHAGLFVSDPKSDPKLELAYLLQEVNQEVPVFIEKKWKLLVDYDNRGWPIGARLDRRSVSQLNIFDSVSPPVLEWDAGLERACAHYDYSMLDHDVTSSHFHIDDIVSVLEFIIHHEFARPDLVLRQGVYTEEEKPEEGGPVPDIADVLADQIVVPFSSDHFSYHYPYAFGVADIDFKLAYNGALYSYFFTLQEKPGRPIDIDCPHFYYARPEAVARFLIEDGNLIDFYIVVNGKKYLTLPWSIDALDYYTAQAKLDDDGYYSVPFYPIGQIERVTSEWLSARAGRPVKAVWDYNAPESEELQLARSRSNDYRERQEEKVDPVEGISQKVWQWAENSPEGATERYQQQLLYLNEQIS